MDAVGGWVEVGERIAETRRAAALSQGELARRVGLERTAVVRIEAGERRITAMELFRLAEQLDVPMSHLVSRPPAPLASRRSGLDEGADSAERARYRLDVALETHAHNAQWLIEHRFLRPPVPDVGRVSCDDGPDGVALARRAREAIDVRSGPLGGLAGTVERFGLYLTSVDQDAEGASMLLDGFGVAVVSARCDPGRRRWTAAHELGHHLLQDAYHSDIGVAASQDERESLIDRFAGEFLLPELDIRDAERLVDAGRANLRAVLIGLACDYRLSWSAVVARARQSSLISAPETHRLRADRPTRGDFLAVRGNEPSPDLDVGETGIQWRGAVLTAWKKGAITGARAVELLYAAVGEEDLPSRDIGMSLP